MGIDRLRLLGYDFMRKMYTRQICPNVDSIRNSMRILTLTNEKFGRLLLCQTLRPLRPTRSLGNGSGPDMEKV
jgi:hypothetical protein